MIRPLPIAINSVGGGVALQHARVIFMTRRVITLDLTEAQCRSIVDALDFTRDHHDTASRAGVIAREKVVEAWQAKGYSGRGYSTKEERIE